MSDERLLGLLAGVVLAVAFVVGLFVAGEVYRHDALVARLLWLVLVGGELLIVACCATLAGHRASVEARAAAFTRPALARRLRLAVPGVVLLVVGVVAGTREWNHRGFYDDCGTVLAPGRCAYEDRPPLSLLTGLSMVGGLALLAGAANRREGSWSARRALVRISLPIWAIGLAYAALWYKPYFYFRWQSFEHGG